jgi:hypothetical protein
MTAGKVRAEPPSRFGILLAAVLLSWPALLNRYPLLYPDSISYLHDGAPTAAAIFLHRLAGFSAMRSELYSLGILPFHWNQTLWPVVALNALLTAYVLWLTIRSVLPRNTTLTFFVITAFLSVFTSVSWFVSLIMPDILGAVLYLGIYLLVFARETLSRADRIALSLIAIWAITAHSTHLMLSFGLCLLFVLLLALHWRPIAGRGRAVAHAALLVALAAATQTALHAYLYGHPSLDGSRPPYLMARIIADGPGAVYLREHCASAGYPTPVPAAPTWAICAYVGRLPDNDDEFLWGESGIWATADPTTQRRLLAEEIPLVRATLRAYPRQQFAASFANFTHQLNDFGVNDFDDNEWMRHSIDSVVSHSRYPGSLQAHDSVPSNAFTILQRWIVIGSAILLGGLLPWLVRRRRYRLLGLAVVVVPTLIANALLTAVLSSSDSRYQARIVWLVPLVAALALLELLSGLRQQKRWATPI